MKRYLAAIFIIALVISIMGPGCGEGNYSSPYNVPDGTIISDPGDVEFLSSGGGGWVTYWLYVKNKGKPINDAKVVVWFFPNQTISSYAGATEPDDFVDNDEVVDWNDGNPVFVTDDHGALNMTVIVPFGFAGTLGVVFDIGVSTSDSDITVTPSGGQCYDEEDNDGDTATDAMDFDCLSPFTFSEGVPINQAPTIALTCPASVSVGAGDSINCTMIVSDPNATDILTCALDVADTCGGTLIGCTNYNVTNATLPGPAPTSCLAVVTVTDNGLPPLSATDAVAVNIGL